MKIINQILFQPTFACNLRCKYCYLGSRRKKPSREDFSNVVPAAKLLTKKINDAGYEINDVLFHGGETTTVSPEILADACSTFLPVLKDGGFITIQTNGTLLTPEYMAELERKINPDVRFRFSISLDGPKSITDKNRGCGTYDTVMRHSRYLINRGYHVSLFGVVSSETMRMLDELENWVKALMEEGINWRFQLASKPANLADEQQVELAHWLYKRNWHTIYNNIWPSVCAWKGNFCRVLHFNADGTFPACDRGEARCRSDNWMDMSFEEAIQARRGSFAETPVARKCSYCPIKKICNSGCPIFRIDGASHECMLRKTIYQLDADRVEQPLARILNLYIGQVNTYANQGFMPSVGELVKS